MLKSMPPENQVVLSFLCNFLARVVQFSSLNKMTTSNIAIVFGPNLLRCEFSCLKRSSRLQIFGFAEKISMFLYAQKFDKNQIEKYCIKFSF